MSATALRVRGLRASLGGSPVLHELDLDLPAGRWSSIVGPNGAGKSTLLKCLAYLLPYQGSVQLFGQELAQLRPRQRARRLAWLGQAQTPSEDLSVLDVTLLGRLPHRSWLAAPSPADLAAAESALRATQAWDWRERSLGQLSAGERQRVLLARALAVQAEVLLMDEPLANLDPPHQADWLRLARELVAQGRTVVSVLHEITFALHADVVVLMAQGRVLRHGDSAEPALHRALENLFDRQIHIHTLNGQPVALPQLQSAPRAGSAQDPRTAG